MKSRNILYVAAIASVVALAIPGQLAAQDKKNHQHMFHHYQLVDLGSTFGGPRSYFNPGSGNDFNPFTSDLNRGGPWQALQRRPCPTPSQTLFSGTAWSRTPSGRGAAAL